MGHCYETSPATRQTATLMLIIVTGESEIWLHADFTKQQEMKRKKKKNSEFIAHTYVLLHTVCLDIHSYTQAV